MITEQVLQVSRLFDGHRWQRDLRISVAGGRITSLHNGQQRSRGTASANRSLERGFLVPGLVDLQVNGGGGVLLNNRPDPAGLEQILQAHLQGGTTSLLPTLLSDHPDCLRAAIAALRELRRAKPETGALGLHVEGPWFATSRRGAHAAERVRPPTGDEIDTLCRAADVVRVVTLAPEVMQTDQIRQLHRAGIRVLAGHSEATARQLAAAREEGLSGFTHLYNAMSPLSAREPGMVGTALSVPGFFASLIADGHHVHADAIRLAARCLGPDKLYLVSDAMATAGSECKHFALYGENITERDGRLVNADGRLAGSAIRLLDALRHCHLTVGLPLEDCLRMCTGTPAALLRDLPVGLIATGRRADFLWLSDELEVLGIWQAGRPTTASASISGVE
ncbi:MAG: N-acetylglucosamine-6-phosphate deacetylase [Haliea sp.]|nr:N-acetylglucosamine-6-phosphate deacetylase [Haliea sp.]|tara:strand:- start:1037 stop:2215 length:1179 start_codon:yes stop_codon:yes gene_type:complete